MFLLQTPPLWLSIPSQSLSCPNAMPPFQSRPSQQNAAVSSQNSRPCAAGQREPLPGHVPGKGPTERTSGQNRMKWTSGKSGTFDAQMAGQCLVSTKSQFWKAIINSIKKLTHTQSIPELRPLKPWRSNFHQFPVQLALVDSKRA